MNKNKLLVFVSFAIFAICFSLGSVSAIDNSTDSLNVIDDVNSADTLNVPEEADLLSQQNNSIDEDKLAISESSSDEKLSLSINSSDALSSSVSVSSGHTFYKNGYKFKVSDSKYKQIKKAIKAGKKQKFLDWGFKFTVKTNKFEKVKVFVKKQTVYKKVRYEGFSKKTHTRVILAKLKPYYDAGWQRYYMSYKEAKNSNKYFGYNYVHFKKTVKTYKTIKMRVYATISYVGEYDYVTGQHAYFPWVSFTAKKSGYNDRYLEGYLLTSY